MRAMAAEAEAARNARAKVIAAEGEHKASRALRHAADVIADSPAALQVRIHTSTRLKDSCHNTTTTTFPQLRYLQTLSSISSENNTTVIFPLPIEVMSAFLPAAASASAPRLPAPAGRGLSEMSIDG